MKSFKLILLQKEMSQFIRRTDNFLLNYKRVPCRRNCEQKPRRCNQTAELMRIQLA